MSIGVGNDLDVVLAGQLPERKPGVHTACAVFSFDFRLAQAVTVYFQWYLQRRRRSKDVSGCANGVAVPAMIAIAKQIGMRHEREQAGFHGLDKVVCIRAQTLGGISTAVAANPLTVQGEIVRRPYKIIKLIFAKQCIFEKAVVFRCVFAFGAFQDFEI